MKQTTFLLAALFAFSFHAAADELETTEYEGSVEFVEVVADEASFECREGKARFLMLGFESEPVVLDLSDESRPVLLTNFVMLESDGVEAAYVSYEKPAKIKATGASRITDVQSITIR